jgi:glycosyltransferase involved in cell wall biosynthesis
LRIAIIIPAFNEAATIEAVVRGSIPHGVPVVVDDGSTDGTAALAEAAGAEIVTRDGASGRGYEPALEAGFGHAASRGAEVVATIDADGQLDPADLPRLLDPVVEGSADLALGQRPRGARAGERLFNLYARMRFGMPDILCGLKAYRMTLYDDHGRFDTSRNIGTELALASLRAGARVAVVPVAVRARADAARFASGWRANARLLGALGRAIGADLRGGSWR